MRAVRLRRPGGLRCYHVVMALDERAFFNEKPETRPGSYQCPTCRRTAKFTKLRDYLLRLDDVVTCKSCGRKFDIPSQHSLVYVDQLAGLPDPDELEREIAAASGEAEEPQEQKPAIPARFTRKSSGWK